ncbi:MAG TPA: hypothetical protein VK498_09980, partial [Ferruginibacter sp.]|nr:hypothetical protein [Ferruginibacter sp.]
DLKGIPTLVNRKIAPLKYGKKGNPGNQIFTDALNDELQLKKTDTIPWSGKNREMILNPISPGYLGLHYTIPLLNRDVIMNASGNKKKNDIISVSINGQTLIENIYLDKNGYTDDILSDTGLNILTLFAENFGNSLPNKGKLTLSIGGKLYVLDFADKADSAATFIVVKLYYDAANISETSFRTNPVPLQQRLEKNEKLTGDIISTSRQLTFGIWDDAVEDGDTISINIDGQWITRGFPVKKNPQFIKITLKPGPNMISFIGDNLGSIPPNTSVLEIIDGKKRKSFFMQSNLGEKNLIRIFYEVK